MADSLAALLDGLGQTADEVAEFLQGQGCMGIRGHPHLCPVAHYLARMHGEHCAVASHIVVNETHRAVVDTPPAVRDFIVRFDAGDYPELRYPASETGTPT
jgi:hypothetical protein